MASNKKIKQRQKKNLQKEKARLIESIGGCEGCSQCNKALARLKEINQILEAN